MSHPKRPPLPGSERILKKLRALCLAFPGAWEKESWGEPTFRVGDRMFAMFSNGHHGDGRISVWCCFHPDAQRVAVRDDPENFFVPPYVGTKGWLGVRLDRDIGWKRAEAVLRQAYDGVAKAVRRK